MDQDILDILKKISSKAMANLAYLRELTSETFVMAKWMAKEFLNLRTEQSTMENIKIIKNMELANITRMGKYMKAIGKMV
jgi:hypothetical protein